MLLIQKSQKLKIKYKVLANWFLILILIQKSEKLKSIPDRTRYVNTIDHDKWSSEIFDSKLRQAKLATNTDLANDENCAMRLKKLEELETDDLSLFMDKS